MAELAVAELVYNPFGFAHHDDPYVTYKRLRDEAPAYWNPELEFWALSRFEDVQQGFRDTELLSSAGGVALENRRPIGHSTGFDQMIEYDPPEHTVLRKLVRPGVHHPHGCQDEKPRSAESSPATSMKSSSRAGLRWSTTSRARSRWM